MRVDDERVGALPAGERVQRARGRPPPSPRRRRRRGARRPAARTRRRSPPPGRPSVDEVVPTVATTAQASVEIEQLRPQPERVVDRHRPQLELEHPARLLDRGVRVLGADDDAAVRAARRARRRARPASRSTRCPRCGRASPRGSPSSCREPVERQLLQLLQRGDARQRIPTWFSAAASSSARIPGSDPVVAKYAKKRGLCQCVIPGGAPRRGRAGRRRTARPCSGGDGGQRARISPGSTCASTGSSRTRSR